jgi:hypothetical protein
VFSAASAEADDNVEGAAVEVTALAAVDKILPETEVHTISGAVTVS